MSGMTKRSPKRSPKKNPKLWNPTSTGLFLIHSSWYANSINRKTKYGPKTRESKIIPKPPQGILFLFWWLWNLTINITTNHACRVTRRVKWYILVSLLSLNENTRQSKDHSLILKQGSILYAQNTRCAKSLNIILLGILSNPTHSTGIQIAPRLSTEHLLPGQSVVGFGAGHNWASSTTGA
jgi:hypothetical protein